ncbi:MAG: DUF3261 domain-containing protein [Gemmatimonadaceae bacterium]
MRQNNESRGTRLLRLRNSFTAGRITLSNLMVVLILVSPASACRSSAPPTDINRLRIALSPAAFPQSISLQQHVEVEQGGKSVDFEAVLDVTPEAVTLVGLAFNQRVFTLKYDGVKLQESRSKMLPREVQAGDVLSDLQIALWPADAVRSALPAGWILKDSEGQRVLSQSDTARTTITYSATPRWSGTITLQNHQYDYRLLIKSAVAP